MNDAPSGRIFISYRRQEAAWPARQLYVELSERFGSEQVFKDVDDINPGDDFVERIADAVGSCEILLALIGRQWLTVTDDTGQRRIDDPADFVRIEVASALARSVTVIPILLDGAPMPRAADLPEDLASLSRRQGVALDPVTFDTSRLFGTIDAVLRRAAASGPRSGDGSEPAPVGPQGGAPAPTPVDSGAVGWPPVATSLVDTSPAESPLGTAGPIHTEEASVATPTPATGADLPERLTGPTDPAPQVAGATTPPVVPETSTPDLADRSTVSSTGSSAVSSGVASVSEQPTPGRTEAQSAPPTFDAGPQVPDGSAPAREAATTPPTLPTTPTGTSGPGFVPAPARGVGRRPLLLIGASIAVVMAVVLAAILWPRQTPSAGVSPATSSGTAAATGSSVPTPSVSTSPSTPTGARNALEIMAHRGGQEVHQLETKEALQAAARDGYAVETDVRLTSDGVAVIVHDELATKGLDCGGRDVRVSQTTWANLRKWCRSTPTASDKTSYPIATYTAAMEGIASVNPSAWVFVEVKWAISKAQAKDFLDVLINNGLRKTAVVTAANASWLATIRSVDPSFPTMLFVSKTATKATSIDKKTWGVAVEKGVASADYVRSLQQRGFVVVLWLLNDEAEWEKAKALNPASVMTDFPGRYAAWLAAHR